MRKNKYNFRIICVISLLIVLFRLFGFSPAVCAQTQGEIQRILARTNVDKLKQQARELKEKAQKDKAHAVKVAKQKGWAIRKIFADGRVIELQRLDLFGYPEYYISDNANAADTISTDEIHPGGSSGLALTGSGMTVGEWDTGAVRTTHQELTGRAIQQDGSINIADHATHVAGTLIAGGVDANARGMAYQASLDAYDWNSDDGEMASAASGGLLASNHSYGLSTGWSYGTYNGSYTGWYWHGDITVNTDEDYKFGFYSVDAQTWDQIAVDAPYYLIVKSAGNHRADECPDPTAGHYVKIGGVWTWSTDYRTNKDGGATGYDTIAPKGNAKNILTVGAVYDISGGYNIPSDVIIAEMSSWGPTDDGRIKPDIVANGKTVYSSISTSDTAYQSQSGTSMATPSVTGSLILLQQHYNNLYSSSMLSATLKALVIHTADEAGSDDGPDYRHGWGLMNTPRAADVITQKDQATLIKEETLNDSATYSLNVTATGTEPLVVTLAWTDPAGTPPAVALDPTASMLVNDLDLRVAKDAVTFYPWILDPANPSNAAATGDNARDNVEKIEIASPVSGAYTITVIHKSSLQGDSQNFSLIVTGITEVDNDVTVSDITPQVTACEYSNATPVDIVVSNVGKLDQTDIEVSYEVTKPGPITVSSGTIAIDALSAMSSEPLTVSVDMTEPGVEYTLTATATLTGDENTGNNSQIETFETFAAHLAIGGNSYTQDFESASAAAQDGSDLASIGWSDEDVNGDGGWKQWYVRDSTTVPGRSGTRYAACRPLGNNADDWLFSNCLYLKTGQNYRVTYYVYTYTRPDEELRLAIGTTPTAAGMATTLRDDTLTTYDYQQVQQGFTVTSDGVYYLGWYSHKVASDTIYMDDITIENISASVPEMEIRSNGGIAIADNDMTPSPFDHTDFGSIDVNGGAIVRTFTIYNLGTANLTFDATPVAVTGAGFSVTAQPAVSIAAGGSDTFTISFDPSSTGVVSGSVTINNNAPDENPYNFSLEGEGTTVIFDFGDAPAPYPTLLAADGARHSAPYAVYFGTNVDGEPDGQPDTTATGDDISGGDDEDGVTFTSQLFKGELASVTITLGGGASGYLNAWIDFNGDGDWADAGEQIFADAGIISGANNLDFSVPADASSGLTYARFRVSSATGLSYDGSASDGEVEDYQITITSNLCGSISGILTPANSPYSVTCNITVEAGQSLTIESGVVLEGLDNHSFTVYGELTWEP